MSKWIEQLELAIKKEPVRPQGNWKTQLELVEIIKCSADNCRKFLQWCIKTKRIKMIKGTSLTTTKILTSKIFYKPIKKDWKRLYMDYAKSKERRPVGTGWKTFTQICRDLKLGETAGRKILDILRKKNKLEVFRGGIVDQSTRVTAIKFYRLKE